MIVRQQLLSEVIEELQNPGEYSLDTETTGLAPWLGDKLFSIIISNGKKEFYFNFQNYEDVPKEWTLDRKQLKKLKPVFENKESLWFLHNAKFDMAMLYQEGLEIAGTIHCTEAIGRVEKNNRLSYKLEVLAKEIGYEKDDAVKKYIKETKLYKIVTDEDGEEEKVPMYNMVPFSIIVPYGEKDARITWELGQHQIKTIKEMDLKSPRLKQWNVVENERKLTKVCFEMEKIGVRVNKEFSQKALKYEFDRMDKAKKDFKDLAGCDFVDSAKVLAPVFDKLNEKYPLTDKGNPSFKKDVLEEFNSPIAKIILDYRNAQKRASSYFSNFLKFSDKNSVIHPNIRQGGAETGRMSYSQPSFQNLPKRGEKRENEFNVRRSVIPTLGNALVMLDYDQMEYRLMLEYAREMGVINDVLAGLDVHAATAKMMGIEDRETAKTLNFMLLYGGGVAKLCAALFSPIFSVAILKELVRVHLWKIRPKQPELLDGIDKETVQHDLIELKKALALQETYFEKLPRVKEFTRRVIDTGSKLMQVHNWFGRRCRIHIKQHAYILPNHIIQGGCADVMKIAMVKIFDLLKGKKSKMILQVHDELIFDMHPSEFNLIPKIKEIMETAYPYKYLPLTCGVDHSWVSWSDKEEGMPNAKKA